MTQMTGWGTVGRGFGPPAPPPPPGMGPLPPNPPRPAAGGIMAGSSPSIHSTDWRIAAGFFSQSPVHATEERSSEALAGYLVKSTVVLLLVRHLSKSHGNSRWLSQVRVERPNWMSS